MESSDEHAATSAWNIAFDFGRKSSESFAELKNLMDHYGDGFRRRHNSPLISDGRIDEPWKNSEHNEFNRYEQRVQEIRHRRSSMGVDAGMSIHNTTAEASVRGTDRLHHTNEYEDDIVHRKKTQLKIRQMEQHRAKFGKSQRWTNDLDGLRA